MTLILNIKEIYANPYRTNLNYLLNMTSLQVKALKEMEWIETSEYIDTGLWGVPWAWDNKKDIKESWVRFRNQLNERIKGL